MKKITTRDDPQFKIKLPDSLNDIVRAEATRNRRSINSEVVFRIEESFDRIPVLCTNSQTDFPNKKLKKEVVIRLPVELRDHILFVSRNQNRSVRLELLLRLKESFYFQNANNSKVAQLENSTNDLMTQIKEFKEQASKIHLINSWAETYRRDPFEFSFDQNNNVIWMVAQVKELWDFWQHKV